MKKYELTEDTIDVKGITLFQVRYLKPFKKESVKIGDLGGYVESEENLSHEGDCLILDNGIAMGNSRVTMNAVVRHRAMVSGQAILADSAMVMHDAVVCDYAMISGNARIRHSSQVSGNALIKGNVELRNMCEVYGNTILSGDVMIQDEVCIHMDKLPDTSIHPAHIYEKVKVSGEAQIKGKAILFGTVLVSGEALISGSPVISGSAKIKDTVRITVEPVITGDVEILGNSKIGGKAMITGTVLIKDSEIRDRAVVTGKSSITDKCYLYDQSVVADSKMMNGAQLHDKAKLTNSTLDGFIEVHHSAVVTDSNIQGKEIVIMDIVYLEQVVIQNAFNLKFKDNSVIKFAFIHDCEDFRTYDDSVIDGEAEFSWVNVSGATITLTGNAHLGKDVVLNGTEINITEYASVEGNVIIGSEVGLYELARIENQNPAKSYSISKRIIKMDKSILIKK